MTLLIYDDLENKFIDTINYDKLLYQRETINNHYTFVNQLHAIKSSIDFLTHGNIKTTYHYWINIKFRDLYPPKSIYCEDYPYRSNSMIIERKYLNKNQEQLYVYYKNLKYECSKNKLLYLFENFIDPKRCKLEKIGLYRVDKTINPYDAKYVCLYESKIYNKSSYNQDVRTKCFLKIYHTWKQYLFMKHKQLFKNVCTELEYYPNGGYNGKMLNSLFEGGIKYLEVKKNAIKNFTIYINNKPMEE